MQKACKLNVRRPFPFYNNQIHSIIRITAYEYPRNTYKFGKTISWCQCYTSTIVTKSYLNEWMTDFWILRYQNITTHQTATTQ